MPIITYPLNDIQYNAADAELFHCTRRSGVFMGSSGNNEYNDFDATASGSNRIITIQPGLAWIRNGQFKGKAVCSKSAVELTLTTSNATYPRYDAVVLRFSAGENASKLVVVKGSASANPIRPTPSRTENGSYDLHLYHVYRPAGSSVVTSDNIEDMRPDLYYCGYMVDDVSAFDEGKFLSKTDYDPTNSVAAAGGIPQYVQTYAPKVSVSSSVTSTSSTTAASSAAVRTAYQRAESAQTMASSAMSVANNALPKSQKGVANGVASLGANGKIPSSQLPEKANEAIFVECVEGDGNTEQYNVIDTAFRSGNWNIRIILDDLCFYLSGNFYTGSGTSYEFFTVRRGGVSVLDIEPDGIISYD